MVPVTSWIDVYASVQRILNTMLMHIIDDRSSCGEEDYVLNIFFCNYNCSCQYRLHFLFFWSQIKCMGRTILIAYTESLYVVCYYALKLKKKKKKDGKESLNDLWSRLSWMHSNISTIIRNLVTVLAQCFVHR